MAQANYYRVTMIVKARPDLDEESLMDALVDKVVNKNVIVEVESSELADDFDLDDLDEDDDEDEDELLDDDAEKSSK